MIERECGCMRTYIQRAAQMHTRGDVTVVIHHASVNEMTGGEAFDSSVAASQT